MGGEDRDDPWDDFFEFTPEDLFRDFERMFDELFSQMSEMSDDESTVWGFSVSQRPGEDPEVRSFGGVGGDGPSAEPDPSGGFEHSPLVEAFDTGDEVEVIAEVPGASEDDVSVEASPRSIRVSAETELGALEETVELPAEVDPGTVSKGYNNGVLRVALEKA